MKLLRLVLQPAPSHSVYDRRRGDWQVNFSEQGKQRTICLGRHHTAGSADRIARILSDILAHRKRGESLPVEIVRQIERLPANVHKHFTKYGLIGDIVSCTLASFLEAFYVTKSHLKPGTQVCYRACGEFLVDFFGKEKK